MVCHVMPCCAMSGHAFSGRESDDIMLSSDIERGGGDFLCSEA